MPMTYRRPPNFTERSRRVVELASTFAEACGHSVVSPLHVAIGLVREGEGVAATALRLHGIALDELESELAAELSSLATVTRPEPRFAEEFQALLDRAGQESRALGHSYVGTEHLLLALVRDSGAAARLLGRHGFTFPAAKARVLFILNGEPERPETTASPATV